MELAIRQVEPGMVAGIDVRDRTGRVLIAAGTSLDAHQIKMLKAWGVGSIDVEGLVLDKAPLRDSAALNQLALELIDARDQKHPLINRLVGRLAQKLSESKA